MVKVPSPYSALKLYVLIAAIVPFVYCPAQTTWSLSPQATRVLVDSLAAQINKYYVFKDTARDMSLCLKQRLKEGRYNAVNDPNLLAALLTEDVASVYRDEHFHVEYHPDMIAELSNDIDDVPRLVEEKLNRERARNFGFRKTEILTGNIGYLEISGFSRLNRYSREAAVAALKMLSNSRALIIDLRYGAGGSPEMINYLMGFFLKERTHTSDVYIRSEKARIAYWSAPDSSAGQLYDLPIYVLTSYKTFSAAEGLAYELQALKRATVVGEVTRGGAHTVSYRPLSSGFIVDLPFGRVSCPAAHNSNWEKRGVQPDVLSDAATALEKAEQLIMEKALNQCHDAGEKYNLQWQRDLLLSEHHPLRYSKDKMKTLAGSYGAYTIVSKDSSLYYQKSGKARFELLPMSENVMKAKGNDSFRVRFETNDSGQVKRIVTSYDDGRSEIAERRGN